MPVRPPLHRREGPGWWSRHGGTVVMIGSILFILNDPIDRLLPVGAPALQPGPATTWDPAVVVVEGRPTWAAAGEAGRSGVPGSPPDAWPSLQAALAAAGLPQAEPVAKLEDLRTGRLPDPDPAGEERLRVAAQPVFTALAAIAPDALFAVADPPGAVRASALADAPAQSAVRQLIRAAVPAGEVPAAVRLQAAGRLAALVPVAAGLEDLEGAALAQRAEAGLWRQLIGALAEQSGDAEVRRQAEAIRGGLRQPAMPAALRRARLDALRACHGLHDEVMGRASTQIRVNAPPDLNHALALLNRWFDSLAAVLPADLADGRALAVLAAEAHSIPELDVETIRDDRSLAARMLFDRAVDERRRQTGAVLATLVEMRTMATVRTMVRSARRAGLLRAAVQTLLTVPQAPGAARAAEALNAALPVLPPTGGTIAFRTDGRSVLIVLQADGKAETIATIRTDDP